MQVAGVAYFAKIRSSVLLPCYYVSHETRSTRVCFIRMSDPIIIPPVPRTIAMTVCWVNTKAVVFTGLRSIVGVRICVKKISSLWALQTARRGRKTLFMAKDDRKDSAQERDDEQGKKDWDTSWTEFKEKQDGGGLFKLPPEESQRKQRAFEDERTERLTNAWSNDRGFLLGIGVIVLIGLFYGYVFMTGGISR